MGASAYKDRGRCMTEWNDVEKLAMWVIGKKFGGDIAGLIGESYLCFLDCLPRYQPEYSNFATFYRTSLEGWLKDYLTYNAHVVHVPRLKQDSHLFPVSSLSEPVSDGDSTLTLQDMIKDESEAYDAEDKETAMWLSYIDDIYPRLTKAEQKAVTYFKRYIVDGTEVPREYRTQIWSIRQKLLTYVE